nr:sigma factor-like helix-turn-helix DNA-binding protein [Nannocystis sp.]
MRRHPRGAGSAHRVSGWGRGGRAHARLPATGPDRAVYSHELRGALDDAVASLPAWLHSVFCMRIIDEVPYPDVCQQFKISPVNARQRIQQARRHLRSRLSRFT